MKISKKAALVLALTAGALAAAVTQAAAAEYFAEDFESPERVYDVSSSSTPFGAEYPTFGAANSTAVTAPNPAGEGNVLKITPGASGTMNMDICANDAGINTGRVSLSMDMYLPKKLTDYDIINIQSVSGTKYELVALTNKTTAANTNAAMSNYPVGEWFTMKWTWDYNNQLAYVSMIKGGEEYTVRTYSITAFADGLSKCRIAFQRLGAENVELYVDNLRYADENIANYPQQEKVWYHEDFHSAGITYNLRTNGANYGSIRAGIAGGASAVTEYNSELGKNALKLTVPAGATLNLENQFMLTKRITGIQSFDVKMYIPKGQLEGTTDKVFVFLRDTASKAGPQINLIGPNNNAAIGTNLNNFNTRAVIGEEFTLRVVFNYPAQRYAAYIITNDGKVSYRASTALGSSMKTNGLGLFRISPSGSAISMYVTDIKYYDGDNMPHMLGFDNGEYAAGTTFAHNYADVNFTTAYSSTAPAAVTTQKDPAGGDNLVLKFTQDASAAMSGNAARIDTWLYTMTAGEDIVVASADFYLPRVLEDSEHICMQPFITKDSKNTLEAAATSSIKLNGKMVGYAPQDTALTSGIEYPVGEWFTLRQIYNTKTGVVRIEMVKADGSAVFIQQAQLSDTKMQRVNQYGFKKIRVFYTRGAGSTLENTDGIYCDNLAIKSLSFADTSISYDDWEYSFKGSINYEAKGDIDLPAQMIMSAYDADGNYIDCEIFDSPRFYDGEHFIDASVGVDPDADYTMKMMLWDNISGMKPYINVEEY